MGPAAEEVDKELVRARVAALNSYRWSSYPAYVGKVKKPDWLSTESIRQLFGSGPGLFPAITFEFFEHSSHGLFSSMENRCLYGLLPTLLPLSKPSQFFQL